MKSSIEKRIKKLEQAAGMTQKQRPKFASVVCDPDILHTHDFSFIEADCILILPDNGLRLLDERPITKGSYAVCYS